MKIEPAFCIPKIYQNLNKSNTIYMYDNMTIVVLSKNAIEDTNVSKPLPLEKATID